MIRLVYSLLSNGIRWIRAWLSALDHPSQRGGIAASMNARDLVLVRAQQTAAELETWFMSNWCFFSIFWLSWPVRSAEVTCLKTKMFCSQRNVSCSLESQSSLVRQSLKLLELRSRLNTQRKLNDWWRTVQDKSPGNTGISVKFGHLRDHGHSGRDWNLRQVATAEQLQTGSWNQIYRPLIYRHMSILLVVEDLICKTRCGSWDSLVPQHDGRGSGALQCQVWESSVCARVCEAFVVRSFSRLSRFRCCSPQQKHECKQHSELGNR